MAKPEPNDADRRRAERISVWLREQGIVAKGIQGVDSAHLWNKAREMFAAEFAGEERVFAVNRKVRVVDALALQIGRAHV